MVRTEAVQDQEVPQFLFDVNGSILAGELRFATGRMTSLDPI